LAARGRPAGAEPAGALRVVTFNLLYGIVELGPAR
jgi:hypothetical protein